MFYFREWEKVLWTKIVSSLKQEEARTYYVEKCEGIRKLLLLFILSFL